MTSEATTESQHQVKGRLFLDVIVLESAAILKLLSGEDEALLVWGDAFLVLDLGLHVLNSVALLNIKGNSLASEGLYENLHATTQTEDKMEGRLLLDIVILEGTAVFELLAGEDKPLLVWRDSFFVLNLGLDILNGVRLLNVEGNGLAGQGLNEDLHATTETEDEMESRFLLDVVVL